MPQDLRPEGIPVHIGDVVLVTPGLAGQAEVHPPASPGMRAAEDATDVLRSALAEAGMGEQLTVQITDQNELDSRGGSRAGGGEDDIVVDVPGPGDGNGQVLLYAAEDGSLTWHYPDAAGGGDVQTRGGARQTYRIPRAVVAPESEEGTSRGLVGAIGSKILKVLVFPLLSPVIGRVANDFAARWEARNRPPLVRWFGPDDRNAAPTALAPFTDEDWSRLAAGPALMFVHGTFSTARGGFGALPESGLAELHRRYEGRV
ncbi:MAG TPA: hypothetical protein VF140_10695, partial [Phycicoccus sp.]